VRGEKLVRDFQSILLGVASRHARLDEDCLKKGLAFLEFIGLKSAHSAELLVARPVAR